MRIVLDTNALVSGVIFGGAPGELLGLIDDNIITPCFIPSTFQELERVLRREKFIEHWHRLFFSVDELLSTLKDNSLIFPEPRWRLNIVQEDSSDNKFLAGTLAANAAFIISGDRHLLALKSFRNIPILTPRQFLNQIKKPFPSFP